MRILILLFGIVTSIIISCNNSNNDKTVRANVVSDSFDSILFKGTDYQIILNSNFKYPIKDVSTFLNTEPENFIQLSSFHIKNWMDVFPNIGGHNYYLISVKKELYYYGLSVLVKADAASTVYLISVDKNGSFLDAIAVYSNYRGGPVDDTLSDGVLHRDEYNTIFENDTVKVYHEQRLTKDWTSNEFYNRKIIEYYTIDDKGIFIELEI